MKKFDQSADKALSRFAKDSRMRRSEDSSDVKRERTPRKEFHKDTENNEKGTRRERRSFNPNFTADNRPRGTEGKSDDTRRRSGHDQEGERTSRSRTSSFRKTERKAEFPHGDGSERQERRSTHPSRPQTRRSEEEGEKRFSHSSRSSFGKKDDRLAGHRTFERRDNADEGADRKPRGFHSREKRSQNNEKTGARRSFARNDSKISSDGRSFSRNDMDQKPKSYPRYNPNRSQEEMRLNRFIAQSGMCSRREADEYIKAGLVKVNGETVTELGVKVKLTDEIRFSDEKVRAEKNVYILLNKPKGYVTTTEDEHADHTVMELVANACKERIYPVGRLDKDSLGLLLFTNDGDITRALTHPSYNKKKIYEVTLDKPLTRADFDRLAEGVQLEDGEAYFDQIEYTDDTKKTVGAEIHSGRNRIVRRMFDSLGYKVRKLDRVYYAGLTKKNLKRGAWRFLTDEEVAHLKSGRYE